MTGKQLKDSILQWAIQGKLVPQDPNDEPASALLEKIREEKARLVKEKKIKKPKTESIIFRGEDNSYYEKFSDGKEVCIDEEIPFELPNGWEWVRLGDVGEYRKGPFGSSLTKSMFIKNCATAVKVYEQKNAIQKDYKLGDYYISQEKFESMRSFVVKAGDIIVSCAGTIGETYILPDNAPMGVINQALMRVSLYNKKLSLYWVLCFEYLLLANSQMKGAGSAIKNIPPFEILKSLLMPIPPYAEQLRIIDKLSTSYLQIQKYETSAKCLELLNQSIRPLLKKSILQEAIQGKLIPQDPADEPASLLLEKIKAEKERLIKEKKIKRDKNESIIFKGDDNSYYERIGEIEQQIDCDFSFPSSWGLVRLSSICQLIDGKKETGSYPCLDAKFLRGKCDATILDKGRFVNQRDNIILVDGENSGEVFRVPQDGYMGSTFKQLWVSKELHLPYILYVILFYKELLRNSKKGAAIPHLNRVVFNNLLVGLPPKKEQQRIAEQVERLFNMFK